MASNLVGVEDAAISMGTGNNMSNTESFWFLGGAESSDTPVTQTLYYNANLPDPFTTGPSMRTARYAHCALNINLDFDGSNEHTNQVMIIGGNPTFDSVDTFCVKNNDVNDALCKDGSSQSPGWSDFPNLTVERDGHSCTSFNHTKHGLVIMVTQGWTTSSEVFLVEACSLCKGICTQSCSWQQELNGVPLNIDGPAKINAAMATLNGIPTLFGGWLWDWQSPELTETNEVFVFRDVDDDGIEKNEWKAQYGMKDPRQRHVAVSVPLEFVCAQELTTSTERLAVYMFDSLLLFLNGNDHLA